MLDAGVPAASCLLTRPGKSLDEIHGAAAAGRVADFSLGHFLAVNGGGISRDAAASCVLAAGDIADGYRMGGLFAYAKEESSRVPETTPFIGDHLVPEARASTALRRRRGTPPASGAGDHTHTQAFGEIVALAAKVPGAKVRGDDIAETAHCFAFGQPDQSACAFLVESPGFHSQGLPPSFG